MTITPAKPKSSLYELALVSQEIDGQLAIALDKASSPDPQEQQEAEALISSLLEQANTSQTQLKAKADAICHVREGLLAKARFLRDTAADRAAKAEAEERAAERLLQYLIKVLTNLNPGQHKFELPEHTISARASEGLVVDNDIVPGDLCNCKLEVKLSPGCPEAIDQLVSVITETLRDLYELPQSSFDIKVTFTPDKPAIKAAIKAGRSVPGALLEKRTNWSIK